MKFEGEIGELDLLSRLVELGREKFTGAFRFESDSIIKIIYLKQGDILSASTNDRTDSIDEILLKAGKVTKEHVRQALAKRKESETLGDALLSLGFITKKELTWARRVQLIGILRSIQKWTEGSWTLVADYLPKREEGTVFPLRQVILELILTEQGREKLDRDIAGGEAVFTRSPLFTEEYPSLGLNQEADSILQEVDGQRTAAEIAATAPTDEFNVYKLLQALNILGLIQRGTKPQEEPDVWAPPPADDYDFDFSSETTFPVVEPAEEPANDAATVPAAAIPGYTEELDLSEIEPDLAPPVSPPSPVAINPREVAVVPAVSYAFDDEPLLKLDPAISEGSIAPPEPAPAAPRRKATVSMPLSQPKKTSRLPLILISLLVIVAAAAFGVWKFVLQGGRETPAQVAAFPAQPRTHRSASAPPPVATQTEAPITTTTSPVSTPGLTTTAPAVTPLTTASTSTAASQPLTQTTPPVKPTAIVKPTTTATPPPPATSSAAQSKYDEMARSWAQKAGTGYTVQFELVCRPESIAKALAAGGSNIWFVPVSYRGGSCYRVFWGRFSSKQEAEGAVGQIPSALRESKPAIVNIQNLTQ